MRKEKIRKDENGVEYVMYEESPSGSAEISVTGGPRFFSQAFDDLRVTNLRK